MHLLREDPGLLDAVHPDQRPWAVEHCVAPAILVTAGKWQPAELGLGSGDIGLLVLDGLLLRRVEIDGRVGAELLGEGDLIRPWEEEDGTSAIPSTIRWQLLTRARMAVLTEGTGQMFTRYPALTAALSARAVIRSRRLSVMLAIVHQPRIDVRLLMLLWHLADRWGKVRSDGVMLPLRLSHTMLADLIVAQRPSVTGALKKLRERELVARVDNGWLLCGGPPSELRELAQMKSCPVST